MSALQAGQMLGPYRIISQVGQGGMATVYRAYHAAMDRDVAIKVLPSQLAESSEFSARFRQEARTIASLEHPHILPVYDHGETDGIPYLVMRYLDAGTLKERLEAGQLPLKEIDRLFSQLADALDYAHVRGVIHRDIKPSNALLDSRGNLFLADFGIAKLLESDKGFTGTGALVGTPAYMSPEQAQGLKVDPRTDIYSLGIILYEMITGRVPYQAETPLAVILKHINEPLPLPSSVSPGISPAIEGVILRALEKKPENRFASVADFLAAWKRALAGAETAQAVAAPTRAADKTIGEVVPAAVQPGKVQAPPRKASKGIPLWAWALGAAVILMGVLTLTLGGGLVLALSTLPLGEPPTAMVPQPPLRTEAPLPTEVAPPAQAASPTPVSPVDLPERTPAPPAAATATAVAPPSPAASWQSLPDLPRQINALLADPADPAVLYAGTGSSGSGSGVYRSDDRGLTWHSVSTGLPSADVVVLALGPGNRLYAAAGQHLYDSSDGGTTWTQLAEYVGNSRGFENIVIAPSNGNILYGTTVIEGIFRSDDGGDSWRPINSGLPQDSNGSLNIQAIAIDPSNAEVAYAGTGWYSSNGNGVFKTTDGGQTWTPVNRGMLDRAIIALAIDPVNPQMVYAGSYEGELFKSTDGGAAWQEITPNQMDASQVGTILLDPANPQMIYLLCNWAGVLVSADGGESWQVANKPASFEYGEFTALAVIFGPQPVLVLGVAGEGGWLYGGE